jgi:hypothetical protein
MGRLSKLTDLFQEGVVAPLKASDGTQVVVWLNKLSPFESEQAAHEGRIARARAMLAIREIGTPESDLFRVASEAAKPDVIINALLAAKDNERTVKVVREPQTALIMFLVAIILYCVISRRACRHGGGRADR